MKCEDLISIITELQVAIEFIEEEQVESLVDEIMRAKTIFVAGAGRSGFVGRAFSNRLMHLGFHVYFVGEPTTTCIKKGDLLLILSGSGNTASLVSMAKTASIIGAKIANITIFPDHKIGEKADCIVKIPGTSMKSEDESTVKSIQMAGSIFEQISWLVCDTLVMKLMKVTNQNSETLFARHANLE
ncbi:MAG: 6-phospho 3-hexuloisomerase [Clostridia bacterium]|jgi:6-phospho-3-hexuloisomerase|nr:6-phospho 3-hexuloisomerase [Clostridia bacterium]